MSRWRKARRARRVVVDDRAWSARESVNPRAASADLVAYTPPPAETGPTWAPDRLSVWPLEGGRYGIDAHYQGATGIERAEAQAQRLSDTGLRASRRTDEEGSLVRLGPLTRDSVWIALEAFLGRRMV